MLRRREETLPAMGPLLITRSGRQNAPIPVRTYSGASGGERLASLTFSLRPDRVDPILLTGKAEETPDSLVAATSEIYIFELSAVIATIYQPRGDMWGED